MLIEPMARRRMIRQSLHVGLLAASWPVVAHCETLLGEQIEALDWDDLPDSFVVGVRPGVKFYDLSKLDSSIVGNDEFFTLQHHGIPSLDVSTWRLSISGLTETTVSLTLDDIKKREKVVLESCMECCGNGLVGMHGLVGNATWGGARLAPILRELGVRASAREVVFTGADLAEERIHGKNYPSRFARSLPLSDALMENVLLAYEMNGRALPTAHGYPLRLIVPGWYAVTDVKWLERIELVDYRFMGWFQSKDYVTLQGKRKGHDIVYESKSIDWAKLKSIITRVTRNPRTGNHEGELTVHGVAWNDGAPINSVELKIDEGPWQPAKLVRPSSPYGWVRFSRSWRRPGAGAHHLVSRAIDAKGTQPTADHAERHRITPYENNGRIVRRIVLP